VKQNTPSVPSKVVLCDVVSSHSFRVVSFRFVSFAVVCVVVLCILTNIVWISR
jgi:hypothetical protein